MVRGEADSLSTVCMICRCQCNHNWMTSQCDNSLYDLAGSKGNRRHVTKNV